MKARVQSLALVHLESSLRQLFAAELVCVGKNRFKVTHVFGEVELCHTLAEQDP